MATINIVHTERQILSRAERVLLALILEQINVLRQRAGLAQITKAQAIARLKELLRA